LTRGIEIRGLNPQTIVPLGDRGSQSRVICRHFISNGVSVWIGAIQSNVERGSGEDGYVRDDCKRGSGQLEARFQRFNSATARSVPAATAERRQEFATVVSAVHILSVLS
jgi:hypothetical protein